MDTTTSNEPTNPALRLFEPIARLLLRGRPAGIDEIAASAGQAPEQVREALSALPDVEWDASGRVVGLGLTLKPTRHRFRAGGQDLYTWCALDGLLLPRVLRVEAEIESQDAVTGEPVRLRVGPDGVVSAEPAAAVMSVVDLDRAESLRASFCEYVHFFRSAETAAGWLATHPGARVVPVDEAFRLGLELMEELR